MRHRAEADSARALACLYSPPAQRELLEALCGLEREIGASLAAGLDHEVAHTRLGWWREECRRCREDAATHPLTRTIAAHTPPAARAGLSGLVDTASWDLAAATFETRRELTAYCERWSEAMIQTWAPLAAPEAGQAQLRDIGRCLRETELLLQLPGEARAGRLRLPLDELARVGAASEELSRPPWSEGLAQLLRERHGALQGALHTPLARLPPQSRSALRPLVVWSAVLSARSRRAMAQLPAASAEGAAAGWRDAWHAWRAARRGVLAT